MGLTNKQKGIIQDFQELMLELGGTEIERASMDLYFRDGDFWFSSFTMRIGKTNYRDDCKLVNGLLETVENVMEKINAQ